jgi:mRNA-degrading endonuclease RelE of RelBE toxin-antitoxin system
MTFAVKLSPTFKRQAKEILSRYPAFKDELVNYMEALERHAPCGDQVQRHRMVWKDRLGIKAYKIGKRGGLRIIMHYDGSSAVYLLMIYCKRDIAQPTDREIQDAISELQDSI